MAATAANCISVSFGSIERPMRFGAAVQVFRRLFQARALKACWSGT